MLKHDFPTRLPGMARTLKTLCRVLTLAAFFHFSGLNNSFSCMTFSTQSVGNTSAFAPVFISALCRAVSPVQWVRSMKQWKHWAARPNRIVRHASQRAVQNLLMEPAFFHTLRDQALNRAFKSNSTNLSGTAAQPSNSENHIARNVFGNSYDIESRKDYIGHDHEWSFIKISRVHALGERESDMDPPRHPAQRSLKPFAPLVLTTGPTRWGTSPPNAGKLSRFQARVHAPRGDDSMALQARFSSEPNLFTPAETGVIFFDVETTL